MRPFYFDSLRLCKAKNGINIIYRLLSQSYPQIHGNIRKSAELGSKRSRALRQSGLIPGVVYGVDEDRNVVKFPITVPLKEIIREIRSKGRSLENCLYEIVLDNGTRHLVTPRQVQLHPLNDLPISANFLKYWPGNMMRIPFTFINEEQSVDLKRGCFLVHVNSYVDCICDDTIPEHIPIDVTGIKNKDIIRLSSVTLPPGVRPAKSVPSDYVICVVRAS
mmetsp:Transcript_13704/g.13768  ORF Transcript_13704/g.13768 Transcript_13704/m.13768 type:complete len:220 (+) Transcript_13704:51-710(+)